MFSYRGAAECVLIMCGLLAGCGEVTSLEVHSPGSGENPDQLRADLEPGPIDAPDHVRLDSLLHFSVAVKNIGSNTAGPGWFIRVFLSPDPDIDEGDILIDQFVATRDLPAGEEDHYLRNMKLPHKVEPGTYFVGSSLDVTGTVPERNEDNNALPSTRSIRILPKTTSDGTDLTGSLESAPRVAGG
jgi:CARDB